MKVGHGMAGSMLLLLCSLFSQAQQAVATNTAVVVPPLVNFSGILTGVDGKPLTGVVGVTFLLYKDLQGGAPLWLETQNVQTDETGHYTAMLGSTSSEGLPAEIFAAGEARWLAVQVDGQPEQPRILLVSAPYALKAGDAETLGGLPPSAFVRAVPGTGPAILVPGASPNATASPAVTPADSGTTGSGTTSFVPLWTSTSDLGNSVLFQSGTGATANVGINFTTPATTLEVGGAGTFHGVLSLPDTGEATATAGGNSHPLDFVASSFSSTTSMPVHQTFHWQAEPAGNNTATPSATLNLLFGSGTTTPAETGLQIAGNGQITFAAGQTFPGTITGVTAGPGVSVGGTPGNPTLSLNTTATNALYAQLNANNTFTGRQTINNQVFLSSASDNYTLRSVQTGSGDGIHGDTTSSTGYGVVGKATATKGTTAGVLGETSSTGGYGVYGTSPNFGVGGFSTGESGSPAGVLGQASSTSGYGVFGTSPNVGVFGSGTGSAGIGLDAHGAAIGVRGVATTSGGLSGFFGGGPVQVAGNGNNTLIGDPGCGGGNAGLGFIASGTFSDCTNYALRGGGAGDTFINSTGNGSIRFRNNNGSDLAAIDKSGDLTVTGKVHSGNASASASHSNTVQANNGSCVLPLYAPNPKCVTPGMTLTVTTSGGPVLIMAVVGGVQPANNGSTGGPAACVASNFYLTMDDQIISTQFVVAPFVETNAVTNVAMTSLQSPAAGTHTFQVQEADDASQCSSGDYSPTYVSVASSPGWAKSTRTLIVREL